MFYVYVLKSLGHSRHYIGITNNGKKRLQKHNSGSVRSTKAYRPWAIAWIEEYNNKTDARRRELLLKNNYTLRKELFEKIEKSASSSNG
ncbi:MAG: GIY-YIG nuclease family protein [Candidatus Pacebacteria bacterium]|nr:GIY-YIG nuclease family protein [Candidatus Paceibacterota bacterium]